MNRVLLTEDRNAHESDSWVKSLGLKKDDDIAPFFATNVCWGNTYPRKCVPGGTYLLGNVFRKEHISCDTGTNP